MLYTNGDIVSNIGSRLKICATTASNGIVGIWNDATIFGVQFHPEMSATENGRKMLQNFIEISKLEPNYSIQRRRESLIRRVREDIGDSKVLVMCSGGTRSLVTAGLLLEALRKDQVHLVHFRTGK